MDYKKLLERAKENIPDELDDTDRFEIPKVRGHIQGNKTIVSNFQAIAAAIRREPDHLLKYILKELATPGELSKTALIIGTKVSARRINEKIEQYVKDFVQCRECKKPDTKLMKEDKILFLKCTACGAKYSVRVKL